MKTQKLLVIAAIVCLLVGASGVAMAQDTCEGGIIQHTTIDSFTSTGQSCRLQNVTVNGDVTVVNAGKFTMQNCHVFGRIRVEASGDVDLNDTTADGAILVKGNEYAELSLVIAARAIRVVNNGTAYVVANAAPKINCRGNVRKVGIKNQSADGNNCDTLGY